ncbi:hypothetical protein [Methanoregula sp.]|uniref:hypothetical protein n=1 Tax=Methanoregula sp. TaxID=2052170 RepID=UPI0025D914FD|nr:hypothetical protein [Methanoregula sp.]
MSNTPTHDTKIAGTKMQETAHKKSGSGTGAPKVLSSPSKGIKSLKHGSHQVEYRKDHPKAGTGMKTPSAPVLK